MRIIIEAVPQEEMRQQYRDDGLGDWVCDEHGDVIIRTVGVDPLADDAFLVALHELVEMKLCHKAGISQAAVDNFDEGFDGCGEPGDAVAAPYRRQHRQACLVEFLMADMLGLVGYGKIE